LSDFPTIVARKKKNYSNPFYFILKKLIFFINFFHLNLLEFRIEILRISHTSTYAKYREKHSKYFMFFYDFHEILKIKNCNPPLNYFHPDDPPQKILQKFYTFHFLYVFLHSNIYSFMSQMLLLHISFPPHTSHIINLNLFYDDFYQYILNSPNKPKISPNNSNKLHQPNL
jgi:hypothetical protein